MLQYLRLVYDSYEAGLHLSSAAILEAGTKCCAARILHLDTLVGHRFDGCIVTSMVLCKPSKRMHLLVHHLGSRVVLFDPTAAVAEPSHTTPYAVIVLSWSLCQS